MTTTVLDMTGTGQKIDFANPQDYKFDLPIIAKGMANAARFSGQTDWFYSVAQHCVLMSKLVPIEHAMEALFWGAAKGFCGDLSPGMKALLPDYKKIVRNVDRVIRAQCDLPTYPTGSVEIANQMVLAAAYRDLMPPGEAFPLPDSIRPYHGRIHAANATRAHGMWTSRLVELQGLLGREL